MDFDFQTEHLGLDYLDRVVDLNSRAFLGYVDNDPRWPLFLGAEPRWLLTELGELKDKWLDAWTFLEGCRAQVVGDFYRAKGVVHG